MFFKFNHNIFYLASILREKIAKKCLRIRRTPFKLEDKFEKSIICIEDPRFCEGCMKNSRSHS